MSLGFLNGCKQLPKLFRSIKLNDTKVGQLPLNKLHDAGGELHKSLVGNPCFTECFCGGWSFVYKLNSREIIETILFR
jgi:hypothetical protein